jgi:MFS family permease
VKNKTEKLWTRDFVIVMIACSGISFCNYFFSSTLPIYATNMTGTTVYAGLIMTVYTLSALASRPLTGYLNNRVGRVRMLVIGAALCAVACFLYQFSAAIALLIAFRILHGIGFGIHSTSGATVAADVIPRSRMSEGLGIYGLYGTIASAFAPGIALGIIGEGNDNSQFAPLFILAVVISVVCMVLDGLIRYERRAGKAGEGTPSGAPAGDTESGPLPKTFLGFEAGVLLPSAVIICVFAAFSSVSSFLTLFAQKRDLGNIGLFFVFSAAGMFLSRAFLGKVADRRGADILVIPALIALVFCYGAIPFIYRPAWLFALGIPIGLAQGVICPAVNTIMFRRCTRRRRSTAAAAYFSSIDLGIGLGALLFGFVVEYFGFSILFWIAAFFAAAAAVIYLLSLTQKKIGGRYLS